MEVWKRIPKDVKENLKYRHWLLKKAENPVIRRGIIQTCKEDILFWVNSFVWTYDPRTKSKSIPFVTYAVQDRAFLTILECIRTGEDLVIEKSRDMGGSWISLTAMDWLFTYHQGQSFLMVSRKEDLVDAQGDPDSLFWKIDFIHRHLPGWLLPGIERRKLHFGNLDNGSTIDGESTTAAAGVGGRRTAMFIDEFSRIEEGHQLVAGTADTTRCRVFNFTPYGTANASYELARRSDVRKLRLHWSDHDEKAKGLYKYNEITHKVDILDKTYQFGPSYNFILDGKIRSPWYDRECARRANPRDVAQMLDIDYLGSTYQFFDRGTIMDLKREYAVDPYWEGDVDYDPDTGKPLGLLPCPGGPLKLWTTPDRDGRPPRAPYAGGADIATGTGKTNSSISFVDARTGEKVMEYSTPFLRPDQLALRAVALCWLFKSEDDEPCRFVWEMQGPGVVFGAKVVELGYRNIYFRKNEQAIPGARQTDTPGWYPSPDNKRTLLENYRAALATRQFINRSGTALDETTQFVHTSKGQVDAENRDMPKDGDPSGASVNHADRVIADALAWFMVKQYGIVGKEKQVEQIEVGSLSWRRLIHEHEARQNKWF